MTPKEKQILSIIAAIAVLAGGYVWASNHRKTSAPQPQNQTQQQDEMVNWKTYNNDKYGYEVKYPAEWKVKEYAEGVEIGPDPDVYRNVSFSVGLDTRAMDTILSQAKASNTGFTNTMINGQDAVRHDEGWTGVVDYFVAYNGKTLHLTTKNNFGNTADQILSTFKFTK